MGRDKALLPLPEALGGADMVTWTAQRLAAVCDEVLIADRGRGRVTGHPSIEDGPGKGPAAGILGAAAVRPGRALLALACDLPLVPVSCLRLLVEHAEGSRGGGGGGWVVPISDGGRLEPLCSVYGVTALERLESRVGRGLYALRGLEHERGLEVKKLASPLWRQESGAEIFANVNTPRDFEKIAAARQICLRPSPTSQ